MRSVIKKRLAALESARPQDTAVIEEKRRKAEYLAKVLLSFMDNPSAAEAERNMIARGIPPEEAKHLASLGFSEAQLYLRRREDPAWFETEQKRKIKEDAQQQNQKHQKREEKRVLNVRKPGQGSGLLI